MTKDEPLSRSITCTQGVQREHAAPVGANFRLAMFKKMPMAFDIDLLGCMCWWEYSRSNDGASDDKAQSFGTESISAGFA